METYLRFLEKLDDRVISQNLDRVIVALADEGLGKSTLILETIYHWETEIRERDLDIDDLLRRAVWSDPDELRHKMVDLPQQSCIGVMDAARLLNRKEAMKDEQKEIEKDLFDARALNHILLLGFQSPRTVPEDMGNRRAKNLLFLPSRGRIRGYNRESMDEWDWEDDGDLPDPDLVDSFPALDGTDLWERFQDLDEEKKEERIRPDDDGDDTGPVAKAIAPEIKEDLAYYISQDGRNGELYIDPDMILLEYDVSHTEATQTRKLLRRDDDIVVDPDEVRVGGEVVREVDLEDDESESDDADEQATPQDMAEEVYHNLGDYISKDGRSGDFMLDPDLIELDYDISAQQARKVRKLVERFEDVSINDDVVSRSGDVVASKSRDL